ncbi:DUF4386 family protein, partial [Candidatus Dojkabacteria bacterium]|nr:DUF4386 family protein [Candidatus Dojkabacteria bacterium]
NEKAQNPYYDTLGELFITARAEALGYFLPLFFCLSAAILYFITYKSKVLPRFISIWGMIGVIGIVLANLIPSESEILTIFALPIILNEIFMGFYLIFKGFNTRK